MPRFRLVLLLALCLWPSAAAASASAPIAGAEETRPTDQVGSRDIDYQSHALRSSTSLGSVLGLEARCPRCAGGCTHRSASGGTAALHRLSGAELLLTRARLLAGLRVEDTDVAVTPLCEHLPYDATAPPSRR